MRRAAAFLITPVLAAIALAGCGSGSSAPSSSPSASSPSASSSASASAIATGDTYTAVTAAGVWGKAPTVTIPAKQAAGPLYTKTLIEGTGPTLTTAQAPFGNFALYDWSGTTHKLVGSTFSGLPVLFAGQLVPGLEKALIGQRMGSRVLAVIPPADGFGSQGNSQIGIKGTDTVVYVVDLIKTVNNTESAVGKQTSNGGGTLPTVTAGAAPKGPTITIPKTAPPKTLQVKTLIKGTGAVVKKGQYIAVQYTGLIWRTGKVFDSSWSRGVPFGTAIGANQVIKGWDTGLVGQTVGSRVLLVIPPADGYGSSGSSTAGIKGTDTLVFVVDILSLP